MTPVSKTIYISHSYIYSFSDEHILDNANMDNIKLFALRLEADFSRSATNKFR